MQISYNSALINLNVVNSCVKAGKKIFIHRQHVYTQNESTNPQILIVRRILLILQNQIAIMDGRNFYERFYLASSRNYSDVRIARFHNIFDLGSWNGLREKHQLLFVEK